jgi:hypothetical protein
MGNEGNAPDFDMKIPSLDLDLPEPTLNPGGGDISQPISLDDLKFDGLLDLPGSTSEQYEAVETEQPAGKKAGKKAPKAPKAPKVKKPGAVKQKAAMPKLPRFSAGAMLPVLLNVLSIVILLVIAGIMVLFEVPVNVVPDLTLTTYVQSLWLVIGCLFVVAMLQDIKTALLMTGIDIAMLATVFPTLWLLLDTPMNPLYFFVIGMIVLMALVVLPLNVSKARAPASGKSGTAGAAAPAPTGPRTTS